MKSIDDIKAEEMVQSLEYIRILGYDTITVQGSAIVVRGAKLVSNRVIIGTIKEMYLHGDSVAKALDFPLEES